MAKTRKVISVYGEMSFYTIETAIGIGQNNMRLADVELVQFFLKQYFINLKHMNEIPKGPNGEEKILIDGIAGPQTLAAIKKFQINQRKSNSSAIADGLVSVPISNNAGVATLGTMWTLNSWFLSYSPLKEYFNSIKTLPDVQYLAPHLYADLLKCQQ